MITLTLLHPLQNIPVQSWIFDQEPVIRIGRATDNHVILYSAVVSRHHVELRRNGAKDWEIVSLGTNGTYLDGKRITQVPVVDGVIIRLARSGPNIQIRIGSEAVTGMPKSMAGERTLPQQINTKIIEERAASDRANAQPNTTIPVPPHLELPAEPTEGGPGPLEGGGKMTRMESLDLPSEPATPLLANHSSAPCQHLRTGLGSRFCLDCGQPLQVQQILGDYQIMQTLGKGEVGITYVAWRNGQSFVLKTLNPEWVAYPKALELFEQEAKTLQRLQHSAIPRFIDFFFMGNLPYLAVEMMHGQDLAQYVAHRGPVSQPQAIAWMLELCDVLEYLHSMSPPVLHRDIQPAHLIRRSVPVNSREIALVDFGTVKFLAVETMTPFGSGGYTAPEQQERNALPASDLYALGPTLIYLLTGKDPSSFYGNRDQGFRLYAEFVPDLSPEMVTVIRKLTNPLPEERYGSARELAEVLHQMLE